MPRRGRKCGGGPKLQEGASVQIVRLILAQTSEMREVAEMLGSAQQILLSPKALRKLKKKLDKHVPDLQLLRFACPDNYQDDDEEEASRISFTKDVVQARLVETTFLNITAWVYTVVLVIHGCSAGLFRFGAACRWTSRAMASRTCS